MDSVTDEKEQKATTVQTAPAPQVAKTANKAAGAPAKSPVAANPIKGAFGFQFGQKFNPTDAVEKLSLTNGTPLYKVIPTKKFRDFNNFYVLITPSSHKIHSIWAEVKYKQSQKAAAEQKVINAILGKKYKKMEKPGFSISPVYYLKIDNRQILTKSSSGYQSSTLELRYSDASLEKLAETERITAAASKTDDSAL